MDKLTLEHIAPYLPYGLKCHNMGNIDDDGKAFVSEIVGLDQDSVWVSHEHEDGDYAYSDTFPILRPLSDLTKEIDHNGEMFVPIIELYRNSSEYYNNKRDLDYEFIDSWGAKGNILKVYKNRDKDEYTEFVYSNLSFRKDTRYNEGSFNFGMYLPHPIRVDNKIHNIYILQKLLLKWHFDVFGLIEKGLAIDINSLSDEAR